MTERRSLVARDAAVVWHPETQMKTRPDPHALRLPRHEEHFHSRTARIPRRAMAERRYVEVAAQVSVDAQQHVQVECGADAQRVVVREEQPAFRFHQIGAYEQCASVRQ